MFKVRGENYGAATEPGTAAAPIVFFLKKHASKRNMSSSAAAAAAGSSTPDMVDLDTLTPDQLQYMKQQLEAVRVPVSLVVYFCCQREDNHSVGVRAIYPASTDSRDPPFRLMRCVCDDGRSWKG